MTTTMTRATLLLLTAFALHCQDKGTEPTPERVRLTLIDAGVREAYLHIAVATPAHNETLALQRNGATVMTFAAVADTTIADTGLTQTSTYQYTATLQTSEITGKSNTVAAQTLAPTSHYFTWQTFLLGDGYNSELYDVAIINDTLIYAVGELYLRDSTGHLDETLYNLAIWKGATWEVQRVTVATRFGLLTLPFEGIQAFSPSDMWIAAGDPIHWNGQRWVDYDIRLLLGNDSLVVSEVWGTSSSNMYFVGGLGTVVHFDGNRWHRLPSGTRITVQDVWGTIDPVNRQVEVYAAVSRLGEISDKKILRIREGDRVDSVHWGRPQDVVSVWSQGTFPLYVCGGGVFENSSGIWKEIHLPVFVSTTKVRGNAMNNIFVVGAFGLVAHWNGIDWFTDIDAGISAYTSIAVSGKTVVIVGAGQTQRAVVKIGSGN